jgi:sRNA-binding regulator protein Hfq
MPYQPMHKRKVKHKPRFNYAVETNVDRCVREQNRFLDHCVTYRVQLTIIYVNGGKITGIVHDYDRDSIQFGGVGKEAIPKLIRKTFIAMIIPREEIELFLEYRGLGTSRRKNRKQRFLEAMQNRLDSGPLTDAGVLTAQRKRGVANAGSRGKMAAKKDGAKSGVATVTSKPVGRRVTNQPGTDD